MRTWRLCLAGLLLVGLGWGTGLAQQADEAIDFQKARLLRQRVLRGEKLSAEEQAYLDRALQARQGAPRPGGRPAGAPPAAPPQGLKPLTDMTADDRHHNEDGGLYGGGSNEPPQSHLEAALRLARTIEPLDAEGRPAPDGKVVLISIGMSNTTQEFSRFQQLAAEEPSLSRRLVIVDGAQGGMDARAWARPDQMNERNRAGRPDPWMVLARRLEQAGVTPQQVQVAWVKQALIAPGRLGEFPKHAEVLQNDLRTIVRKLRQSYPNVRIAYLSSRTYAGYATSQLNPEPYAYESAFSVRRLIQQQMGGDKELNFAPQAGEAAAPLLLWGPYLWADGEQGRQFDDLTYERQDLAADGTHPSNSGRQKVAEQLLRFFKTNPTTKGWFLKE